MIIDPSTLTRPELNGLVNGLVAPRPIAWTSTIAADGSRNLAPFSFFNAFSFDPPTIGIGPGSRQGVNKDSLRNIKETGEFVVCLVTEELAALANLCSAELASDVDEWELLGVEGRPSDVVRPERVALSPVAFECRVRQVVELGSEERPSNNLVVGDVLRVHVDDGALDGLVPRPDELRLVGRMGGDEWVRTTDRFTLPRPGTIDQKELRSRAAQLRDRSEENQK